ncbi:P-loop containing nucleoside triphosphate hydrolase protein [Amylostereum chailletii]|nr:P-loop containing nucleoside triphosphate hydrolase protein [Amylostereum chailletii]
MQEVGIQAIALSAETLRDHGSKLFRAIGRGDYSVVLLSPERLISKEIDLVLRNPGFQDKLIGLAVDELHTLAPWGDEFRQEFHQVGLVRKRLPDHVAFIGASATLAPGKEALTHPLSGYEFPDIAWVPSPGQKVVIYCETIDLGFRVALYLWKQLPPGETRRKQIRLWNSLTSSAHNSTTLALFRDDPDCYAIVATIAFGLGVNPQNVRDVVNLGMPRRFSNMIQQVNRASRDGVIEGRGRTLPMGSLVPSGS